MDIDRTGSQDMSVEEILKSIKEVINNRNSYSESCEHEDILELTNIVAKSNVAGKNPSNLQMINDVDNLSQQILQTNITDKLAEQATTTILQSFAKIMAAEPNNSKVKVLEDLVVELLRPQLTHWLNQSLPPLVKQLVEKEIRCLILNNQK